MCTGYLAFLKYKLAAKGGLESLMLGRIGVHLGLIKPENIPNLEVFNTVEDMLEAHDQNFNSLQK